MVSDFFFLFPVFFFVVDCLKNEEQGDDDEEDDDDDDESEEEETTQGKVELKVHLCSILYARELFCFIADSTCLPRGLTI